jgi:hypothetical protein
MRQGQKGYSIRASGRGVRADVRIKTDWESKSFPNRDDAEQWAKLSVYRLLVKHYGPQPDYWGN